MNIKASKEERKLKTTRKMFGRLGVLFLMVLFFCALSSSREALGAEVSGPDSGTAEGLDLWEEAAPSEGASFAGEASSEGVSFAGEAPSEGASFAGEAPAVVASGNCGERVFWELDSAGTLTIRGEGEMEDGERFSPMKEVKDSVTSVVVEEGVTTIGAYAFFNFAWMTSVELPKSLREIHAYAFSVCGSLPMVTLPDGLVSVGVCAFRHCQVLKEVRLPEGIREVAREAFAYCSMLARINLPDSLETLREGAFFHCSSLESVELPGGITELERSLFEECTGLARITVPSNVERIAQAVFRGCTVLAEVVLSQGVRIIDGNAFCGCKSLQGIEFPESVTTLGKAAFGECGLTSVSLPETVQAYGEHLFWRCKSLVSALLPSNMERLSNGMFQECSSLREVTLPEGLLVIEGNAFYACSSLTGMELPGSLRSIGAGAFANCTGLGQIQLPEGLAYLGEHAFANCTGLVEVYLPEGVAFVGVDVFEGCTGLPEVSSVVMEPETLEMWQNQMVSLKAKVLPRVARDTALVWVSGSPKVATVDAEGKVLALQPGKATIRAMTANGAKAYCKVTVRGGKVTKVVLDRASAKTNVGLTVQLRATATPEYALDTSVTWKSSNSKVAKVSQTGLVTAVRCGTATISAVASSGVRATCKVSVQQKYAYECTKGGVYRYLANENTVTKLANAGWTCKKAIRVAGKSSKQVYQLYNKKTKRYRYTANRNTASAAKKAGQTVSKAFFGGEASTNPVYEFCKDGKNYRYTSSKSNANSLKKQGWKYTGIAWYAELVAVK